MSKTANPTVLTTKYVIYRVGQNHTYTVHARYFWQGNHQIYGHKRCIYTVLANPKYVGVRAVLCRCACASHFELMIQSHPQTKIVGTNPHGYIDAACVGLARTIYKYIRCVYSTFGRETTIYTVIYGVNIRFWPTLHVSILMPHAERLAIGCVYDTH